MIAIAQPIEIADRHDQIVRYDHVINGPAGSWIFAGIHQGWEQAKTLFVCRAGDGSVLWRSPQDVPGDDLEIWNLGRAATGFIYSGPNIECSLPFEGHTVKKRALDGQVQWSIGIDTIAPTSIHVDMATDRIALFGNTYLPPLDPRVMILDGQGGELAQWEAPWIDPREIEWESDSTVLTLFDAALVRWDLNGNMMQNTILGTGALDLEVIAPDGIRVLYADRLVQLDEGLVPIDTVMLNASSNARWMQYSQGGIWITCEDEIVRVSSTNNILTQFSTDPIDSLIIYDSVVRDGTTMMAGTAVIDERSSGAIRSFSPIGEHADNDEDVGISIGNVDTIYAVAPVPSFPNMLVLHAQFSLLVENNGTSVLDQLLLNTQRTVGHCGADFGANVQLEDLQLAPGADTLIQMPLIEYWPMDIAIGETLQHEVCFVALAPNDKIDRNAADNLTCHQFDLLHTGSAEQKTNDVVIAPMPFTDRFSIQLRTPPETRSVISLHDALGKRLIGIPWAEGRSTMEIDASDLPAGVLLLKLEGGDQNFSRQIMHLR